MTKFHSPERDENLVQKVIVRGNTTPVKAEVVVTTVPYEKVILRKYLSWWLAVAATMLEVSVKSTSSSPSTPFQIGVMAGNAKVLEARSNKIVKTVVFI